MLLANGLRTIHLSVQITSGAQICDLLAMLAMIAMLASFLNFNQARGLDGSSFENSMSCFQYQTYCRGMLSNSSHLSVTLASVLLAL
jgi:hypothetical protein